MKLVIINTDPDGTDACAFWSNEFGWTSFDEATRFSKDDIYKLQLPIDGMWAVASWKSR